MYKNKTPVLHTGVLSQEHMNKVALIKNTQQFLNTQLRDSLKSKIPEIIIDEYSFSFNELSGMDEKTKVIIAFVDGESNFNKPSLIYLKDLSIEKEIPIIFCAYHDEEEQIKEATNGADVLKIYLHPINIKEIVFAVEQFLKLNSEVKKKILVVDDDGMYCKYIQKILGDKYIVLFETSGLSAVTKMAQVRPDLILLDYEMPKLNGFTLYDCIKDETSLQDIPIAFLTSKNDVETVQKAATLGPEGYFLKSMAPEELISGVDKLFARRKVLSMTNSGTGKTNSLNNLFDLSGSLF